MFAYPYTGQNSFMGLPIDLIPGILECCKASSLMNIKSVCKKFLALSEKTQWKLINSQKLRIEDCIQLSYPKQFLVYGLAYEMAARKSRKAALDFIIQSTNELRTLDLHFFSGWKDLEIQKILNAQKNLKSLRISHLQPITRATIEKIEKLDHLLLMCTEAVGDNEIKVIVSQNLNLKTLFIQGSNITSACLPELAKLTKLNHLIIQSCTHLKNAEMKVIVKNHPNLEILHIINSEINTLVEIAKLKNLKNLKLIGCGKIPDLSLLGMVLSLEELTIGHYEKSLDFLDELHNLKFFRMPWYYQIPEDRRPSMQKLESRGIKLKFVPR